MSAILQYTLAGVSLLAAMIVTVLNGLAYAALQSAPHAPAAGLAPVALGVLTCAALIGLNVILHKDVRSGQQWPKWKQCVFYFTGAYLLIAAASITGTMAKDELRSTANQQGLFIARSVFWSFSVFTQGLYYGYLIVALVQKNQTTSTWPHPYSQDMKLETFPDSPATLTPSSRICDPEEFKFDTRRSSLRKYPRRSHRFSGGTLCLQKSLTNTTTTTADTNTNNTSTNKETRPNSFETTSSISTITPQTPTEPPTPTFQQDTRPLLRTSIRSMPSLRREQHIHASLNSLVRPAPAPAPISPIAPAPTSSSTYLHPDSPHTPNFPTGSFPGESNIHPLFRSNSPSPSPTPGLGTSVKASPSAGQTITKQTLTRMRSARSLRERERIPSPLPSPTGSSYSLASSLSLSPEEEREERVLAFMSGRSGSGSGRGRRRDELNESPYER
ncbi:hypothetical protein N7481_006581 [Penicillium waksmanii]|uniref:uncharacterized protein n=1 Tax=Penicillium waksmanii TaxID=69791 RepID=UPI0025491116|nr:uncharacterized protein N7481_006581 [Penicillium waksmanii]KAJ5984482.1 hypothetical protein N7481_006581 [Penicillium waksmanii]